MDLNYQKREGKKKRNERCSNRRQAFWALFGLFKLCSKNSIQLETLRPLRLVGNLFGQIFLSFHLPKDRDTLLLITCTTCDVLFICFLFFRISIMFWIENLDDYRKINGKIQQKKKLHVHVDLPWFMLTRNCFLLAFAPTFCHVLLSNACSIKQAKFLYNGKEKEETKNKHCVTHLQLLLSYVLIGK